LEGLYSAIPIDKDGPVHISRAHIYTLCYIFRETTETPVYPPMTEPLATSLRPSFIILGCIDEEAVHKSPCGEKAVFGQHPKLKVQNMGGG
jgi:hypothetical protein